MSKLQRLAPTPIAILLAMAFGTLVAIVAFGAPARAERSDAATAPVQTSARQVPSPQRDADPVAAIEATFRVEIGEAKLTLHDGARAR